MRKSTHLRRVLRSLQQRGDALNDGREATSTAAAWPLAAWPLAAQFQPPVLGAAALSSACDAAASSANGMERNQGGGTAWEPHLRGVAALLAVAGAATATAATSASLCEADGGEIGAAAALDAARAKLLALWRQLDQDAYRAEAALPRSAKARVRVRPPLFVTTMRPAGGGSLEVRFQVRPGADLSGVTLDVMSAVRQCNNGGSGSGESGQLSVQVEESPSGRTLLVRTAMPQHGDAAAAGEPQRTVSARLHAPAAPSGGELPEVVFRFEGSGGSGWCPGDSDLAAVGAVMTNANTPARPPPRSLQRPEDSLFDAVDALVRSLPGGGDDPFPAARDELRKLLSGGASWEELFGGLAAELRRALPPPEGDGDGEPGAKAHVRVWRWPPPREDAETQEEGALPPRPPQPPQPPALIEPHSSPPRIDAAPAPPGAEAAPRTGFGSPAGQRLVQRIEAAGARVYPPGGEGGDDTNWGVLAGYEPQKQAVEDGVLLPLKHPDVYNKLASATRAAPGSSNRPRAVLFHGPPGCGKTTTARVLASQAALPLVYLPLEAIVSKYYGESERKLSELLRACEELDGVIIFLDELDALATQRSSEMHEATRRVLGVLLRFIDGFEATRSVIIGATNRRQDLDPALLSRFDSSIRFDLPSCDCRAAILAQYARQLAPNEISRLAGASEGMSGRDLRDTCEQTERRWAARMIKGEAEEGSLPPLQEYMGSLQQRMAEMGLDRAHGPYSNT